MSTGTQLCPAEKKALEAAERTGILVIPDRPRWTVVINTWFARCKAKDQPVVQVETRRKKAKVGMDMWPTKFNLNAEGVERAAEVIEAAAKREKSRALHSCGDTYVYHSALLIESAMAVAEQLLAIGRTHRISQEERMQRFFEEAVS